MTFETKLAEFVAAQDEVYDEVRRELAAGRKETHWMWFIFPQLAGLGSSSLARKFALASKAEAERYQNHPVLGSRLRECTGLLLGLAGGNIQEILGYPDFLKFRSSMTLFSEAAPGEPIFRAALDRFFQGRPDERTLELLGEKRE